MLLGQGHDRRLGQHHQIAFGQGHAQAGSQQGQQADTLGRTQQHLCRLQLAAQQQPGRARWCGRAFRHDAPNPAAGGLQRLQAGLQPGPVTYRNPGLWRSTSLASLGSKHGEMQALGLVQ